MPNNSISSRIIVSSPLSADQIEANVSSFLNATRDQTNEGRRKELFIVMLTQLFPDHIQQIQQFAGGAEEYIKIERPGVGITNRGFIDTFFGNLVIEFEHDLTTMLETAESQLQGYVATLWSEPNNYRAYIGIATDGIAWRVYSPILHEPDVFPLSEKNIELRFLESFNADESPAVELYHWLDRILFRDNSLTPSSFQICKDFGTRSHAFSVCANLIGTKLGHGIDKSEIKAAYETWEQYLKYTYGEIKGSKELFIKHTYLSAFTKLLMGNVLAAKKGQDLSVTDVNQVLDGSYFQRLNIRNYVDKDFFHWVNFSALGLDSVWMSIFHSLKTYNFALINSDFLKGIYQDLVDPEDRHDLGEYYTPDWLCEKIVQEFIQLKENGELPATADVTCGSGSFLRAAISRARILLNASTAEDKLKLILKSVVGFEIHPLAVFTAKTNYIMALGDLIDNSDYPISIPIYLCDSLLSPELLEPSLPGLKNLKLRLGGESISLPWELVTSSEVFENLVDYADRLAHSLADGEMSETEIRTGIEKFVGETYGNQLKVPEESSKAICELVVKLASKVRTKSNTIWSFVLKNNYRPVFLSNQFDLIIGNPPWLSYRYISDASYKQEIEYLGVQLYGIAPQSSELRTQMELATVFLAHAVSKYLSSAGTLVFVMPRSIFSADHHSILREKTHRALLQIEELWDLQEVHPLFKVPTCVVVAKRGTPSSEKSFHGRVIKADLPRQDINLGQAANYLTETNDIIFHLATMGGRSALSQEIVEITSGDVFYKDLFHQGADLMPRSFFFVTSQGNIAKAAPIQVSTTEKIMSEAKPPWKAIKMSGLVDGKFLFRTCIADNILPLAVQNPYLIHLPVMKEKRDWKIAQPKNLELIGAINSAKWFRSASKTYEERKTEKAKNLFEMINYNNKLLCQNPEAKYWVLFCSSGKNVCAAVHVNEGLFWADQKTYWYCPESELESYYLAGVLNASSLNEIIKPFQSKGLLGERDIHKKILDVGIPRFDGHSEKMHELATFTQRLSGRISEFVSSMSGTSLARRRAAVRSEFAKDFVELDENVKNIFEDN